MFRMVKFFIFRLSVDGFLKLQNDEDSFFCFQYRLLHNAQSELKKNWKKQDPEGGFYSWFERTNEICSYLLNRTQTFLVKNGFSSLFIKKWNTITKMVLVRLLLSSWRKKKVLKLSMVTYQFVTGSYIMSEIKNKTIYALLVHMHLATLIMANSVIIIFWQPFTPFD